MAITTLANVKTILGITGTTKDTLISALIPLIEADYLAIRNKAFDTLESVTIYPTGSELTAIKMIQYNMNNVNSMGKKSESLGDYSVTYDTTAATTSSYPSIITGQIKKFAKAV